VTLQTTFAPGELIVKDLFGQTVTHQMGPVGDDLTISLHPIYLIGQAITTESFRNKLLSAFVCGDNNHPYPTGDINKDCSVDSLDLAIMMQTWMDCTDPNPPCLYQP